MLPEWAETTTIQDCHILYGGFNPVWVAGRFERHVVDALAHQLAPRTAVVVPTWYDPVDVVDYVNTLDVDHVYICSLTDPFGPIIGFVDRIKCPTTFFGYTAQGIKFDFWAAVCAENFKQYTEQDLQPTKFEFLYLNYNRKPHVHRTKFVEQLEINNLVHTGCVTLGNSKYSITEDDCYATWGANDVVDSINIPNDIYSIGRLDIWQRSFINVVSETEFTPHSYFLSEKTFKPIIGLRPFIINGNPKIYDWLQQTGFDCFADLFPVDKIINCTNTSQVHDLIIDCLKFYQDKDWENIYTSIYPRLLKNKELFNEYSRNISINI
jgi:hypothetical protein